MKCARNGMTNLKGREEYSDIVGVMRFSSFSCDDGEE
jgi:hypothetical protein